MEISKNNWLIRKYIVNYFSILIDFIMKGVCLEFRRIFNVQSLLNVNIINYICLPIHVKSYLRHLLFSDQKYFFFGFTSVLFIFTF